MGGGGVVFVMGSKWVRSCTIFAVGDWEPSVAGGDVFPYRILRGRICRLVGSLAPQLATKPVTSNILAGNFLVAPHDFPNFSLSRRIFNGGREKRNCNLTMCYRAELLVLQHLFFRAESPSPTLQ